MKINLLHNMDSNKTNCGFIFKDRQLLLIQDSQTVKLPTIACLETLAADFRHFNFLEIHDNTSFFCGEIVLELPLPDNYLLLPLKSVFQQLDKRWFPMIVKSVHAIDWDKQNTFCGICGALTTKNTNILEAQCKSCNQSYYPRISPSIIVLIKKENQILMARGPHFSPGVYGLIAGYTAPGESLEETVQREVMEEVSIKVKNIRYFGSQPWPFPDSIMVAFTADYASGEIQVDNEEIIEANWYNVDNLPGYPSSSISIARQLIDHFISQNQKL